LYCAQTRAQVTDTPIDAVDCTSVDEAKYLLQHMYNMCIEQSLKAALNEATVKVCA
jgi:ATP-dependent protease Clp ATPase subunit